ncbi:ribosomal L1 domain-containing protein CG13096 isoform X2 [Halyomorpha halys]|uniref:ribosomal L1 domain-containing protein CG13096 isoform X2 n=1 Tax=Halyomorpha halys TaxID=286706 RepID=UPI0034D35D50
MKTPKVATPKPKMKFNTPKSGLVRKSLGNTPALKKLSTKGKDQVLSMVKDNEENVEFKNKTAKNARMSLPANALRDTKSSPNNFSGKKTPKKSPKAKKATTPQSPKSGKTPVKDSPVSKPQSVKETPQNKKALQNVKTPAKDSPAPKPQNVKETPQNKKVLQNVKTPASVENNTSPVKQNVDSKKNKVPFNLDDSLANGLKPKKGGTPSKGKPNSPEVELGLRLEAALSPKSKKEKKKKMALGVKVAAQGKVGVNKKLVKKLDVNSSNSAAGTDGKKRKRRSRRKGVKKVEESKPSFMKHLNAINAVNALLKASKPKKAELVPEDDCIFLQFNLLKQTKDARGVYKVALPHSILSDSPEVCLVVPDLKGKRNEPEEAIDHYQELLKSKDITSITEIIPVRKLKQDYSQHEERRKFANRFDCIITDGRVAHIAQLGKRFARAKKCICPINFNSKNLKEDIEKALRKVAIFSSGKGTSFSVKCGRRGMPAEHIADNIVAVGEFLANNGTLIGDALNVTMAAIKTVLSSSFPVFVSTVTPNDVQKPKGKQRKTDEPVEDEVTTVENATVVVYPSGSVKVKKRKNEEDKDENVKQKGNKKAKTNASKKVKEEAASSDDDDEDVEIDVVGDGSVDMDSSNDEDSAVDSLNGTDDEASDDESDVEDEEDGDSDETEDDDDDDDQSSIDEEEIEAAEKAYLEELRALQSEIGKKKGKKPGKNANTVEKKEEQVKPQTKNAAAKGGKKQEKKGLGLQNEQKQNKKEVLKEQNTNAKGKKVDKQNQVKGIQNNLPKKNQGASPQNQQKGNQNQKKNKFGSPQNQQKGKFQQFGKGKGPNKRTPQKGGSPKGKKQFKKGPGAKNKN